MKRSPLGRKKPLSQKTPLRAVPGRVGAPPSTRTGLGSRKPSKPVRGREPGENEWKQRRWGKCAVCGTYGRIVRHHILDEQTIRREASAEQIAAGICWDLRNALDVGAPLLFGGRCTCHADHHVIGIGDKRIDFEKVWEGAREFAREVLGDGRAAIYLATHYKVTRP